MSTMPFTPHAPIATNQTIITGPKNRPTAAVPCRCTENSATMITAVIGTMKSSKSGSMTLRPSTADSTEIAGRDHAVAEEQRRAEQSEARPATSWCAGPRVPVHRRSSVISAMIPPSPLLSARITSVT